MRYGEGLTIHHKLSCGLYSMNKHNMEAVIMDGAYAMALQLNIRQV